MKLLFSKRKLTRRLPHVHNWRDRDFFIRTHDQDGSEGHIFIETGVCQDCLKSYGPVKTFRPYPPTYRAVVREVQGEEALKDAIASLA